MSKADEEKAKQIALNHYRGWQAHDTREDSLEVAELAHEILSAFAAVREECAKAIENEHRMGDRDGWLDLAQAIRTGLSRLSEGEG